MGQSNEIRILQSVIESQLADYKLSDAIAPDLMNQLDQYFLMITELCDENDRLKERIIELYNNLIQK